MPQNQIDVSAVTFVVKKEGLKINGVAKTVGDTSTVPGNWPHLAAHVAAGEVAIQNVANHPSIPAAASSSRGKPRGNIAQNNFEPCDWRGCPATTYNDRS
jgi:hypothetical protein